VFSLIRKSAVAVVLLSSLVWTSVPAHARAYPARSNRIGYRNPTSYAYGVGYGYGISYGPYFYNFEDAYPVPVIQGAPNNNPLPFGYAGNYYGSSGFSFGSSDFQFGN
jgi:hypothetical protein